MQMGSDKSFASNRRSSSTIAGLLTADGLLFVSTLNSGTGPQAEFLVDDLESGRWAALRLDEATVRALRDHLTKILEG